MDEASRSGGTKRARLSDGEGSDDEVVETVAERLRNIGNGVSALILADKSRITKDVSDQLLRQIRGYDELVMELMACTKVLEGRLIERDAQVRELKGELVAARAVSVAAVAATPVGAAGLAFPAVPAPRKNFAVIVRGEEGVQSAAVKERVMKEVSKDLDVRVKGVRLLRKGGVAIEVASEEDLGRVKGCGKFTDLGLRVDALKKVGPKVLLYDVPKDMSEEVLLGDLYEKNLRGVVTVPEFRERTRIVSRDARGAGACGNVILEVGPKVAEVFVGEGRVYVGWYSFKVRRVDMVSRCHACMAYGHFLRECPEGARLCRKCGERGHLSKDCQGAERCVNCRRRGAPAAHSTYNVDCPEYKRALERARERVSYD